MKRKMAFLLALVMFVCVCFTACGDDTKRKKETLKDLQEEIEDLEEEWEEGLQGGIMFPMETIYKIEVPRFIGKMYYDEIDGAQKYREFTLKIKWEDANSPDVKKGEVFKQDPAAGEWVEPGATVTLYVNSAPQSRLDEDAVIEGAHKNDVRQLLQDAGFVVNEIISSSDTVEADRVISISIEKGEIYPYGTAVTMVVSTGPAKLAPIEFPTIIIGESQTMAIEALKSYGFMGTVSFVPADYTDEQFAQEGAVMGVKIDGELLAELPDEIDPMADLTLVISSGKKAE